MRPSMSNLFAADTEVTPEKSRSEIERTVKKYGADEFGYGEIPSGAFVTFRIGGRRVKFTIPYPSADDPLIKFTPSGRWRPTKEIPIARAKELRRRWRSLALAIKAKLEIAQSG